MSPATAAALASVQLLNFTRQLGATKAAWGLIAPKYQWIPGTVLTAAVELTDKLSTGINSWTDLEVPVLFVIASALPGAMSNVHKATAEVAQDLAKDALEPEKAKLRVVSAQRGPSVAAKLAGMAIVFLFLSPAALVSCTPQQAAIVESVVTKIVVAALQSQNVLGDVQRQVDKYFADKPDPALQALVNKAIAVAKYKAEQVLEQDQAGQDASAAVADFKKAWAELQPLLEQIGLARGDKLGASADELPIAQPLLLKVK